MLRLSASLTFLAIACLATIGCEAKPKTPPKPAAHHDHPEKGPRGGALAEFGDEEYHAEFLVDHGKKEATVYILDEKAVKGVPIEAEFIELVLTHDKKPVAVKLAADPDKDDPKGKSSRFRGVHDELGKEIDFRGAIRAKIGDAPAYEGTFDEKTSHGKSGGKH